MSPEPEPLPALVVINGAVKVPVKFLPVIKDGAITEPAREGDVMVRLVPLSKAGEYFEKVGNFSQFVELLCDKPAGWADTLDDDSQFRIDQVGRQINDPRYDRFAARQTEAVSRLSKMAKKVTDSITSSPTL
jgi:hypothetical protein